MSVVKFFVNDVKRQLHKAEISREGNRAIDQAKIQVPSETPVEASNQITYVQDMVDLESNRLLFNFCQHLKDESGYKHNAIGHTDFPSACSFWDFQNILCDTGKDQNTTTVNCGCESYIAGKVRDTGCVDRAFNFDGCRYLTVDQSNGDYDFRRDTKWTVAVWVYPTGACGTDTLLAKRDGFCSGDCGWSLQYEGGTDTFRFEISNGTCEWAVNTVATAAVCMWSHVAVTFDGQSNRNGLKIYVNGDLDTTGGCCTITGSIVNCLCLGIGAQSDGGEVLAGRLDGVYTFNKELNICEVKSLYYEGSVEYICGLWDGKAIKFDGETGHATLLDTAPACPRPDNLKLQLKFECNLTDSSDNNSTFAMVSGCETYTSSIVDNKSFCFNSSRYFNTLCTNFNFVNHTLPFSFAFWWKSAVAGSDDFIMKRNSVAVGSKGWGFRKRTDDKIQFEYSDGVVDTDIRTTFNTFDDDNWHHVALTYDGESCKLGFTFYVDGVLDKVGAATGGCNPECWLTCINFAVGAQSDGGGAFSGQLDCIRAWDKELTSKEVRNLHDSTFGAAFRGEYELVTWIKASCAVAGCRTIFHKSSSCTTGIELSIRGIGSGGPGFTGCGFTSTGFINAAGSPGCTFTFRHNNTTLTSNTNVTDCCWHQIRVKRDSCNLISLYVDNVLECCTTDSTCPICEVNADFGRDNSMCEHYDGSISSFRLYSCNLSDIDANSLFTKRNPRSNIKFGGESTKVEKRIGHKRIVTQSFGKQLGEVEVRAEQFCGRTPEYILRTLIKDNTILDTHFHGVDSGIILCSYQADGKLVDIANDLSQLTGKVYRTDGLGQFHLHDASFTLTTASFNHQVNMTNIECGRCDSEVVNCLLIIGENKRFVTSCTFTCMTTSPVDGCNDTFLLAQQPVTARVFSPAGCCTELTPEEQYEVQTATKTLKFQSTDIPACGTEVLIEYEYEQPLNIRGKDDESIADIGIKAKRLVLPWITTRQDGIRFINAYLNNFKNIRFRTSATVPGLANGIGENDVVTFTNTVKGVEGSFIIKSLTWKYPEAVTTLELGEFNFQMLEFAKQITEKIHDLESAVVRIKDLRDFEQPQEVLAMVDTVQVLTTADCTTEYIETLALCDSFTFTEIFDAQYDGCCTTYDGNYAYT